MLGNTINAHVPSDLPPQLLVVIDTEEEFDWFAPPSRDATSVNAMDYMGIVQSVFNDYGIKPCYVVDYPVVSQSNGVKLLKEYFDKGWCEIGAHLHPWVNPPFEEDITVFNTYAGNLPNELEREKLKYLSDRIESIFGEYPSIYKAGRYGLGPNSRNILEELGYSIDLSVCPPVDYRGDGGPDYRRASAAPVWFGSKNQLLEIPISGSFVGWAGKASLQLYEWAQKLDAIKMRGIFSRLNIVDRLMLSPEGFKPTEHLKLTEFLLKKGIRTFTWSFHSTSVLPGASPYVKNEKDLKEFVDSFKYYFDYFFSQLNGHATTPVELRKTLEDYR